MPPSPDTEPLAFHFYHALVEGYEGPEAAYQAVLRTVANECPECGERLTISRQLLLDALGLLNKEPRFSALAAQARAALAPPDPPAAADRRFVADLEKLPLEERLPYFNRRRSRLGAGVSHLCLERARAALPGDPAACRSWAQCGHNALATSRHNAEHDEPRNYALILQARSLLANCARIEGNLREADDSLARVFENARDERFPNPRTLAEAYGFTGSLRRDQRRFGEAEEALHLAAMFWREARDEGRAVIEMVALTSVYNEGCLHERTLDLAAELLADPRGLLTPQLRLMVTHNRLIAMVELSKFDEAEVSLLRNRALYEAQGDQYAAQKLAWLEGIIAAGRGELATAEQIFEDLRHSYIADRNVYDVALVSLELCMLFLRQDRMTDAATLAVTMVGVFEALEIGREALAAWRLFVTATQRQEATLDFAQRLARYLHGARRDPEFVFSTAV